MANKKLRFVALIAVVLMLVCMLVACTTTATSSVSYKVTIHSDGQSDIVWDRQTDFPTLSKEHHTVAGLYLDAEYKTAVTPEDLVNMFLTGDIDVYVKYDRIHYSITVHPLNGGSDVIWQNAPGNKIPEFKKVGYVMSGFYFDENCTQPADSVFTEDILENKEVWVKWVECDHKALAPTDWTTDKKATCTEDGHKVATCPTCDKTLEDTIDALGHNAEGSVDHKDADCTNSGVVGGTYCTRCNNGKDAAETTIPVDPTKHSFGEWVNEVPATCVSTGTKGHKDCSVCNKSFTANNVEITDLTINATGHSYGNEVYVWADDYSTCTAKHVCENGTCEHEETATATVSSQKTQEATCQQVELTKYTATFTASWAKTQVVENVPTAGKAGHNYSEQKKNEGYHWNECSCGAEEPNSKVAHEWITGTCIKCTYECQHSYSMYIYQNDATCEKNGTEIAECNYGCGVTDTRTLEGSKLPHDYSLPIKDAKYLASEATCTAKATYYYSCKCGAKGTETFEDGNYAEHTYSVWVDEVPAKCETDGTLGHYHCSVCKANFDAQYKELESITISATRHKPTQLCRDEDNHWYACKNDGCTYTTQKVAHTWDKGEQTKDPTETEEGVKTYTCTVCWKTKTENTGKLDHVHTFDTTKWSTDDGHHWHPATCAHTDEKDGYAEHTYGDETYTWTLDNTTCIAVHSCKCGYSENETATVTKDVTQAATCTLPEISTLTAKFVNKAFATQTKENVQTADALGHNTEGSVDHIDASCTSSGVVGGTYCTRCDDGKADAETTINALGHDYGTVSYTWATDNSECTATRVCSHDSSHVETETATANASVTQNKTCLLDELTTYTATFENKAFATQTKANVKTADALGHDYGTVSYTWATDNSECTATRVCSHDSSHVETETATANASVTQNKTCLLDELTTYTATFENKAFTTQTKENVQTADALGHNTEGSADHIDATCTETGVEGGAYCTRCNDGKDAAEAPIPALGHVDTDKDHICDRDGCTEGMGEHKAAENSHVCDYCQQKASEHTGGTATCTEKAECTVCGEKYGELDQHTLGILVNETTVKIDSNGNFVNGMKAHYQCSTCEQYFNAEQKAATEVDLTIAFDSTKHYSVAEIIELTKDIAKDKNTEEMLYVKGIVKSGFKNNNTYVQQLYIIDENDSEKEFLVYTCSFTTEIPTIYAGDTVVVYGYIKNYNNTLEVATANEKNATFVSREAGTGTIAVDESVKNATVAITNNQTTGTNGTTFTFTVTASEGYEIASVKVNGTAVEAVDGTYTGTIQGTTIITVETQEAGLTVVATFEFGDNGAASHSDGDSKNPPTEKTWTLETSYSLAMSSMSNVYIDARDAKGNSALKLGTGSAVGSFTFTAPDNVTKVVIYVAKYKKNNTTVTINGTEYVISTASDDGSYTAITIDVSTTKTVSLATVSGKTRCMIDKIEYYAVESGTEGGDEGGSTGTEGGGTGEGEATTSTITVSASNATVKDIEGNAITSPATVNNGEFKFTVTPADGYQVDSVTVGETPLTATDGVYTITVTANTTITIVTSEVEGGESGGSTGTEGGGTGTDTPSTDTVTNYEYTFERSIFTKDDVSKNYTLENVVWSLDAGEVKYTGHDGTKGQQIGSSNDAAETITLTTSDLKNFNKIVLNLSTASKATANVAVEVGGERWGATETLTTAATDYTFNSPTGANNSGTIKITITQTTAKAIYIKSISVTGASSTSSGSTGTEGGDEGGSTIDPIDPTDPTPTVTYKWEKVTSVDNLVVGDKIIIKSGDQVMGGLKSGYFEDVGKESDALVLEVVAGNQNNSFAFKTTESKYIQSTNAKTMSLTEMGASGITDAQSWTVEIEEENAIIKNCGNTSLQLQYNTSSPRFTTYTSSQAAIQIYKQVEVQA